ncbi:MAG: hypothetical protein ACM3SY_12590 [Candidatus Omnitrophota bacterium]
MSDSINLIPQIIDEINRSNPQTVILINNTFFSFPNWKEILTSIKQTGTSIDLIANTPTLQPEDFTFLETHIERISIPFPSSDKKIFNHLMGTTKKNVFDTTIENLHKLGNSTIKTGIFFSPSKINCHSLFNTTQFLKEKEISISHIILNHRIAPQKNQDLSFFEHKTLINQLLHIHQELHIEPFAESYPISFLENIIDDKKQIQHFRHPYFMGNNTLTIDIENEKPSPITAISDDSLTIDDHIELKEGISTTFLDLLFNLYQPFLSTGYRKARHQFTAVSKHKYLHPIGFIAVNHTSANADFIQIALIPDLKEKYYSFLILHKLFEKLPIEKYGWTVHKANYPSISLLERLNGGFYESTIKNLKRVEAEGFFKVHSPVSKKMQAALQYLKSQAKDDYCHWLTEFNRRTDEKQALKKYLNRKHE